MEQVNEFIQVEVPQVEVPQVDPLEEYFMSEIPDKTITDTCGICKKTWSSTPNIFTTTLLCGHTYHSICQALREYEDDTFKNCADETCEYPTHRIIRDICSKRRQITDDTVDELVEANLQKASFKAELKGMRLSIREVLSSHTEVQKAFKNVKYQLIHRHIHTINQIQSELNTGLANIRKGEEVQKYRTALRSYRKIAASLYRKYHISFRDLSTRKIINVGWRVRWILERHRHGINSWQYAIRINPGKKRWNDPIQDADEV